MGKQQFIKVSDSFFIDADYKKAFENLGLTSIDKVFAFDAGENLSKKNLAGYRNRLRFETVSPSKTFFLKGYNNPPILQQIKNWLCHSHRLSCAMLDVEAAKKLNAAGINAAKVICCGTEWGQLFEKKSFCITEKLADAESIERQLPACFDTGGATEEKRSFIIKLAAFVKKFHDTELCHRDLYFSHIFYGKNGKFYLIDLTRIFKPKLLREKYRVKDIAQLYYSAPCRYFSKTDRIRFYLAYSAKDKLTRRDKIFIRKVKNKVKKITRHDARHGRTISYKI